MHRGSPEVGLRPADMMAPMSAALLEAPLLLIAMPQVMDPFFHRSLVLLVHHDAEGSLGFIVNRPTEILLGEILPGMEMEWAGTDDAVAYFGGPVQPQLGTVLYQRVDGSDGLEGTVEVTPDFRLTQHVSDLQSLAADPPGRFRLLLGYAGWGQDQLMEEILRNDWLTATVEPDLVFTEDPLTAWEAALGSVGVDPGSLPSWSAPVDDGGSN